MRFRYEAKDRNAVYRNGVIEAFDRHEAQQKLVQLGLFIISLDMDVPKNVVLVGEQSDPVAAAGSRNLGIWLIIYDLLWLNVIGFIAYFGLALAIGDSAVPVGILVNGFLIAGTAAAIAANSFLIGAGIGFITGKEWARKCALIGTAGVFIFAFSL
ncbi:MAG: hypothetical protein PHR11_05835, partial [Candidatus Omnitrophica bacterium]|nr:hypothetical protein [Candidatus Omnitrophota bacterium]